MNRIVSNILNTLVLAAGASATTAQSADRALVKPTATQPILAMKESTVMLFAQAGAAYAIAIGPRLGNDADRILQIKPLLLLGHGRISDEGIVRVSLSDADYDRILSADLLLQAGVVADGGALQLTEAVALKAAQPPLDRELKLNNLLPADWTVSARLMTTDSIPPHYSVHVTVVVPSTGFRLRYVGAQPSGDQTRVTFEVEDPATNMSHLPVLETLHANANLGAGGKGPIEVVVRRVVPSHDRDANHSQVKSRNAIN